MWLSKQEQLGPQWTRKILVMRELLWIVALFSLGPAALLFGIGYYVEEIHSRALILEQQQSGVCLSQRARPNG
jgi:hypothetical protein